MMKQFILLLLLFIPSANKPLPSPMLYKITASHLTTPSYLFGTFHTKDPKISNVSSVVIDALSGAKRLYTEISMSPQSIRHIMHFSKMDMAIALKIRFSPTTIQLIRDYLSIHKMPYTLKSLKYYKTWAIALILSNLEEKTQFPQDAFMDEKLISYAKHNNIKHGALETALSQLNYFDILSPKLQEQFLIGALSSENKDYIQALRRWYQEGKASGFYALKERYTSDKPKKKKLDNALHKGLLLQRNQQQSRSISILLKDKPHISYFFAIGAGHLSGEKGIISILQSLGYTLKKID